MCKHKYLFWLFSRQKEAKMKSRNKKNCILNQQQFWNKKMTAWFASWHLGQVQKRKVAPGHQKRRAKASMKFLLQNRFASDDARILTDTVSDTKKPQPKLKKHPLKNPYYFVIWIHLLQKTLKHPTLTFLTAKKIQLEKYGEGQRNSQVFIIFWRKVKWYYQILSLTKKEQICFTIPLQLSIISSLLPVKQSYIQGV